MFFYGGASMETAKFCIECGKPLPLEAKHCPNCGAEVTVVQAPESAEVDRPISPAPTPPVPQEAPPAGPYGTPVSQQRASYSGIGTVPPQGPYSTVPASPPQPAPAAPYGGPGAAPKSPYGGAAPAVYPQASVAPGFQRARVAPSAKRLGGGFIAILGGIAILAAQVLFISKQTTPLDLQNLLNVGLGLLCLVSGIVALAVRGWVPVILAALLSAGVFALCGLKLYQTVLWLQAQTPADATAWTLQSGGIIWVGGMMLGMIAFAKAFQTLFRR